jgi:cystathionine beta-synthase
VGGSSGMAVASALKAAKHLTADDIMVVLLPDSGRGYLGKIFNESWMRSHGFAPADGGTTIGDVLRNKSDVIPALAHVHPSDTVRDAIGIMTTYGISQLPVLSATPPVVLGEVVGAIEERPLLEQVFTGAAKLTDPVGDHLGAPLGLIGANQSVDDAKAALAAANALLVIDDGKPIGIISRQDVLSYLAE